MCCSTVSTVTNFACRPYFTGSEFIVLRLSFSVLVPSSTGEETIQTGSGTVGRPHSRLSTVLSGFPGNRLGLGEDDRAESLCRSGLRVPHPVLPVDWSGVSFAVFKGPTVGSSSQGPREGREVSSNFSGPKSKGLIPDDPGTLSVWTPLRSETEMTDTLKLVQREDILHFVRQFTLAH